MFLVAIIMPILFQNQYYDLENKDDLEKTLNQLVDFYQQSTEEQQERFAQKLLSHYPAEILTSILFSVVKSGHAKGLVALLQISQQQFQEHQQPNVHFVINWFGLCHLYLNTYLYLLCLEPLL